MRRDVHDVARSGSLFKPAGVGPGSIDQLLPFQPSANGAKPLAPEASTAVHALADVHDTPASMLSSLVRGFGVDWVSHSAPFQRSANVCRCWFATLR